MRTATHPIRFRGAPARVSARLDWPQVFDTPKREASQPGAATIQLLTLPFAAPVVLFVRADRATESHAVLSFRLPRSTRPGTYEGVAEMGGRRVPIVVEVDPEPNWRITPPRLVLRAGPRAKISTELLFQNLGNVDFTVEGKYHFCIFDNSGFDQAAFHSLAEDPSAGEKRIDRFMDELAKSHGGLVRVIVTAGSGRLAAGEERELHADLHFPDRLRPGRTYFGTWRISKASYAVEIETEGRADSPEEAP